MSNGKDFLSNSDSDSDNEPLTKKIILDCSKRQQETTATSSLKKSPLATPFTKSLLKVNPINTDNELDDEDFSFETSNRQALNTSSLNTSSRSTSSTSSISKINTSLLNKTPTNNESLHLQHSGSSASSSPPVSSSAYSTPVSSDRQAMNELRDMLKVVVDQNKELLRRVTKLEEEKVDKKKKKDEVDVPNEVRFHVKLAYTTKESKGEKLWDLESNKGPFADENLHLTKYIRVFVSGLYPVLENRDAVINSAIKKYYESKISQKNRKRSNPDITKIMSKNQRRIHKAARRKKTLNKHIGADVLSDEKKKLYAEFMISDMMSSEDEKEDDDGARYFEVRKPKFRSDRFEKLLKKIDKKYHENCSQRSKDQYVRREIGLPSEREKPKSLPDDALTNFLKKD